MRATIVLVVSQELDFAATAAGLLSRAGHAVFIARTLRDAALAVPGVRPDVLLFDAERSGSPIDRGGRTGGSGWTELQVRITAVGARTVVVADPADAPACVADLR